MFHLHLCYNALCASGGNGGDGGGVFMLLESIKIMKATTLNLSEQRKKKKS